MADTENRPNPLDPREVDSCLLYELLLDLQSRPNSEHYGPIIQTIQQDLNQRFENMETTVELFCKDKITTPGGGAQKPTPTPSPDQNVITEIFGPDINYWKIGCFALAAFIVLKRL